MSIDYSRLHSLTAREIISALIRDGFYPRPGKAGTGSHQRFQHQDGRRVTVTVSQAIRYLCSKEAEECSSKPAGPKTILSG